MYLNYILSGLFIAYAFLLLGLKPKYKNAWFGVNTKGTKLNEPAWQQGQKIYALLCIAFAICFPFISRIYLSNTLTIAPVLIVIFAFKFGQLLIDGYLLKKFQTQ